MMDPASATSTPLNPLSIVIFGFAGGIFLASFFSISPLVSLLIIFVGIAILAVEKSKVLILVLILTSFGLGSLRYAVKDFHNVKTPTVTGVVVSEPEDKENTRRFTYLTENGEKVLVSVPLYTSVAYGDRVEVKGKPERPGVIKGFNYGAYLSKDDTYWTESFADVTVISHNNGNPIKSLLFKIKENFIIHIQNILPEPYAALLAGLLISGRESLPASLLEEFRRAGVIHIVVLSGFNVTLVAEFLRKLFQRMFLAFKLSAFPWAASAASILGIVLFTLMTGATATVVRAAVMAVIAVSAKLFGRSYSAPRALSFAAFLMLMENPKILVFDPSFELSFLATLGLMLFMDPIQAKLSRVTEKFKIRETLAQTLATQLTVLPLLVYSVGDISTVSLPANLLILPLVPVTMLVGFMSVLLSYVSTFLAWPVAYLSHLLLGLILFIAHFLGTLSFATVAVPGVSAWMIATVYICLFFAVAYGKWRKVGGLHGFERAHA